MIPSLSEAHSTLQSTEDLPEEIWDEWLWRTDPEEPYSPEVLLNRCQLLGSSSACSKAGSRPRTRP